MIFSQFFHLRYHLNQQEKVHYNFIIILFHLSRSFHMHSHTLFFYALPSSLPLPSLLLSSLFSLFLSSGSVFSVNDATSNSPSTQHTCGLHDWWWCFWGWSNGQRNHPSFILTSLPFLWTPPQIIAQSQYTLVYSLLSLYSRPAGVSVIGEVVIIGVRVWLTVLEYSQARLLLMM